MNPGLPLDSSITNIQCILRFKKLIINFDVSSDWSCMVVLLLECFINDNTCAKPTKAMYLVGVFEIADVSLLFQ